MTTTARHHLSKPDAITVARIEAAGPGLAAAREPIERLVDMIRHGRADPFPDRPTEAETGVPASLARGPRTEIAAVTAALREPWSTGQTEGQIDRLKTLERQISARADLDLLRARLVAVP
jgi:hypothetical protein